MKKVLTLPVCTRDRKIVSIEQMSTFYMKSAVYTYIEGTNHQKEISIEKSGKPKQGGILFFNGPLIFHILDVENEPQKTSGAHFT